MRNNNTFSQKIESSINFWEKFFFYPVVKYFLKKADFIVNQSIGMNNDLLKLIPKIEGKTCVIYNPVLNYNFDSKYKIN